MAHGITCTQPLYLYIYHLFLLFFFFFFFFEENKEMANSARQRGCCKTKQQQKPGLGGQEEICQKGPGGAARQEQGPGPQQAIALPHPTALRVRREKPFLKPSEARLFFF